MNIWAVVVPKTRGSCLSEMKVCIQDSVCNAQLSGLFKSCSEPGCDGVRCQRAARRFYDGLPLGVAEMLVFCACEPDDPQCLSVRADIQSPACPERPEGTRTRTCLEARDDCVKDPLCRKQYGTFQSKCLRSESIFCHAGESCFGPVDLDLILGSDFECRRAFFGTMGTVLHQPCTCDGLNSDDRHACLFFRSIFHDKSPFVHGQNKGNESHEAAHVESRVLGLPWFGYQVVFLLVCILIMVTLITGIMVVLHKLG
ncbi:GDNF family receptor alpha-like [Scleropages formosus]|uniref:GDNF family receptor alpha-like n=1 Tax=Scleropages formosus TaxID=113540 RepID=UPI0010FA9D8B|nr:GDNF family receptor alpha-like [Scleropages formosus]